MNHLETVIQRYRSQLRPEQFPIFDLLLEGHDHDDIARKLNVSSRTVSNRAVPIYRKLKSKDRVRFLTKIIGEARVMDDSLPVGCRTVA